MVSITTFQVKMINQIKSLAEKHPDEVKIIQTGLPGILLAHLPKKYLHISIGERKKKEWSDEQKMAAAERLKAMRERKRMNNA